MLPLNTVAADDRDVIIFTLGVAAATETAVEFVYRDRDGVISLRCVQPIAIGRGPSGALYVRTFDIHRNAPRCFRVDSVLKLV